MDKHSILAALLESHAAVLVSHTSLAARVAGDTTEAERAKAKAAALAAGFVILDEKIAEEMARNAAQVLLTLIAEEGD